MKLLPLAAALCLGVSPIVLVSTAYASGSVGDVLLSSGGLAEIVKHVELTDGEKTISLEIPADQADDVLKSLIVGDPAGSVASVTIDGANAVDEAFRHMPFTRADLASTASIVAAMTGYQATIDDGAGHQDTGTILGVSTVQRATAGQPVEEPVASLQRDDGSFVEVLLGPGASVFFADPNVEKHIDTAISAVRRASNDHFRTIRIETTGTGARTVDLSYVVAAPVWKAAYRIVPTETGKYRVQGWAVLENGTGDAWNNVRLTLSSSNPVALKQRLSAMIWRDRREVPIMLPGGSVGPMVDAGNAAEVVAADAEAAPMAAPPPALARMAVGKAMAAPTGLAPLPSARGPETISSEGDVGITFALPEPVSLKAGETLTVPIIDADFDADLVSMWQDGGSDAHPLAAIFLANASDKSVPPGIFTIYGKDGYLGDAQVAGIPPGEKRFAAFAADAKTRVTSERDDTQTIVGLKAGDGLLNVTQAHVWTTVYHITAPNDAERSVMIDHMRVDGADISSNGETVQSDPDRLRVRVKVAAGKSDDLKVTEKKTESEAVSIGDSNADTLLYYASTKGIEPAIAEKLKAVAAIKARLAGYDRAIDKAGDTIDRLTADQERVRANLKAVPETSDSAKAYLAKLDRSEKAIEAADAERSKTQDLSDKARSELDAAISSF